MKLGKVLVEQINKDGDIIYDYDISLTPREIFEKLKLFFKNINKLDNGIILGNYHGNKYMIRIKNITYLGNPHPTFKKRIQIPVDLFSFYRYAKENNATPILMGIYSSMETTVFCDFEINDYINNKANNSSAHIYSLDISKGVLEGYFTKTDFFDNRLTVFSADNVETYLSYKFGERNNEHKSEIVRVVDTFVQELEKEWNGIACYKEMIAAEYANRFQPEWPGFYLEYQLAKTINENRLERLMVYAQDKKIGGIDLDLYFPTLNSYGDLKTHSTTSNGILGNDWDTIHRLINIGDRICSVYSIVLELDVTKDSDYGYEVTLFWNKVQNKSNLMSYSKKMKHDVKIVGYYILEINRNNQQHLKMFRQGKNSNGKPRNPKIMISNKDISNFLIHKKKFI